MLNYFLMQRYARVYLSNLDKSKSSSSAPLELVVAKEVVRRVFLFSLFPHFVYREQGGFMLYVLDETHISFCFLLGLVTICCGLRYQ